MKKIFVLCAAAIVALSAVSCQKDDTVGVQAPEFNKEGLQKYTFTVSGVETKMDYDTDPANHTLTPKWTVGDKIYVYDSDDAYFEVTAVADNGSATVVGYAKPSSGQLTLIYHPRLSSVNPENFNLRDQEGHLGKDFPAIYYGYINLGHSDPTATFVLMSFILEIPKVTGISKNSVIDSIIVEGENMSQGLFTESSLWALGDKVKADLTDWTNRSKVVDDDGTLSESVFISLARGSITKITIYTNNGNYCWKQNDYSFVSGFYRYVSTKTFTLVYPGTDKSAVKVGNLWWAPVNCGYDNSHPNGLLYQWGRKYGQVYIAKRDDGSIAAGPVTRDNDASNQSKFIKDKNKYICWYSSPSSSDQWNGNYNPCPDGWRVPTKSELESLGSGTWTSSARLFADGKLTFPAAGNTPNNGDSADIDESGYYWSSTTDGDSYAIYMKIDSYNTYVYNNDGDNGYRSRGMSVRCVKDAN